MANKSNHNQSVQRQVNDYEISRLRRVQENKRRIQDLGLKRITNSLTSLVDSQKTKKNKVRSTYISNARDEQYIPDNDDDSEEDNTNVEVSKKQHRPRYIASQTMNRVVDLVKKNRVTAAKSPQKFPLDSNAMKKNQCRSTISMGELISKTQMEVLNTKVTKPNCFIGGSKGRLLLVDEDDDEDDWTFQDMEQYGLENDDIMRSQDEDNQDKEYEDMEDMTTTNNKNNIQMDDSSEDLENEDDAHRLEFEQLQHPELEKSNMFDLTTYTMYLACY